jgi:two-component system, response regulator
LANGYILMVEDNPDDEELTRLAFEEAHIANELVVVRDGSEAISFLLEAPPRRDPPQLILLDLKLPKVGGLEVLERLRAEPRTRLIPIVILTSSSEEEDIISSYLRGANSYVRKPVEFHQFLVVVQQLGLYWLLLNQSVRPAQSRLVSNASAPPPP